MNRFKLLLAVVLTALGACRPTSPQGENETQTERPKPRIVGAMRNVMWKGELFARIDFDTLQQWDHLYALGPIEGLQGEFVVYDGRGYRSSIVDGAERVTETRELSAPFAGYDYISDWQSVELPDSVKTTSTLGNWLVAVTDSADHPFFFTLEATIDRAVYHVMALPEGTIVDSPDVAHRLGRKYFGFSGEADLLGFFGMQHKGIFTHHDSYTHIHLLARDRSALGHLDTLLLGQGKHSIRLPADVGLKTQM